MRWNRFLTLFFFAYSLCVPPWIDNIKPNILVTPFNRLTGDDAHIHTHTDANTGGMEQVVCLLSFILCLAENCCAFQKMSRPWSLCTTTHWYVEGLELCRDVGRGICRDRGLLQRRVCAPQITLQPLMELGPPLLEITSRSASNRSPPRTPLVMIGFSYKAEMVRWW